MDKFSPLLKKYSFISWQKKFNETMMAAFEEAKKIDPVNGINDYVVKLLGCVSTGFTLEQFISMIDAGLNPRYANDLIFFKACRKHDVDVLSYLINQYQVDVNAHARRFCVCMENKSVAIIKLLLDNGLHISSLNICDILTLKNYSIEKIQLLMDYGIDLDTILVQFDKVLIESDYSEFISQDVCLFIISQIKNATKIGVNNIVLSNILKYIMRSYNISLDDLIVFINLGVDPLYNDNDYFISACGYPTTHITSYLVNHYPININAQKSAGLCQAINHCAMDNIKLLLEMNVMITDDAIDMIIQESNLEILKLLINHGLDPWRVAHFTLSSEYNIDIKIMQLLVEWGVDYNQVILQHKI